VNPYLGLAALTIAMEDGINRKLDPGDPEEGNIYEAIAAGKKVSRVPMTLGEALQALADDELVKSTMPGEMLRVFEHYKRDEWERYCAEVSDWDVKEYLDVLP
jgi:glutamine synthetase